MQWTADINSEIEFCDAEERRMQVLRPVPVDKHSKTELLKAKAAMLVLSTALAANEKFKGLTLVRRKEATITIRWLSERLDAGGFKAKSAVQGTATAYSFCGTTGQAQDMFELAPSKGLRAVVGHQYHYEPAVLQMADMVQQGYIGKPLAFSSANFVSNHITPRPSHRVWLFQQEACGHPGFRIAHSLERVIHVLGDVSEVCADMRVLVPERPNLDGGPPPRTTRVNNLNFLLRVGDDVMGTLQVSLTAWFGTGWIFQAYGTEGTLMVKVEDAAGTKDTVKGDPKSGELKLYGARVDMDQLIANPVAPELLQREFKEIQIEDRHFYVTGFDHGRATFPVAQMWHAFAGAINAGVECAPSFRDVLKMHYVMDAIEKSMQDRRWVKADYSGFSEQSLKITNSRQGGAISSQNEFFPPGHCGRSLRMAGDSRDSRRSILRSFHWDTESVAATLNRPRERRLSSRG